MATVRSTDRLEVYATEDLLAKNSDIFPSTSFAFTSSVRCTRSLIAEGFLSGPSPLFDDGL
jgi:hypothetical protein